MGLVFPLFQNSLGQMKTSYTTTTQSKGNLYGVHILKCHPTETNLHLCPKVMIKNVVGKTIRIAKEFFQIAVWYMTGDKTEKEKQVPAQGLQSQT